MDNDNNVSLRLRDTLSGAFGSVCLTYAGLPFDVVKLRMQTSTLSSSSTVPLRSVSSLSPWETARTIIRQEGITRLWRGAGPALTSAMVENTVVFTANGFFTRLYSSIIMGNGQRMDEDQLTFLEHFAIGGLSGIFSATAICPPEVIKCRLQYHRNLSSLSSLSPSHGTNGPYRNGWTCAKYIYHTEGIKGFFSGLLPLLYRDVPFNTLFFGSYRVYSYILNASIFNRFSVSSTGTSTDKNENTGIRAFMAGGFAGMTAWAIIFPFDVIKTKMQILGSQASSSNTGTFRLLQQIVREEGFKRLYYGSTPAILRAFPANAALFWGVETAKTILKDAGFE